MAGSNFYNLATQFSASASRLRANINSVIEKYDRRFEDDDLISLASMSVSKLSARGTLKKIKNCHGFGESHLKTTKRKDEILKLKLGLKENNVDLNVSRAIERECVDALANLNEVAANEPSDAETLSSFDEDDLDDDDSDENKWFENSIPRDNVNKNSDDDSGDGHLSDSDIHCQEDWYSEEEDSYSPEDNLDSSDSDDDTNVKERNIKVVKNTTVTIVVSSDSEDEVDGVFALKDKTNSKETSSSPNQTFNCTYVLHSPNEKSQFQHENGKERIQDESKLVKEHNASNSTFVSISSPRPKVKDFESLNHRQPSNLGRVNFGYSASNLKFSGSRQTCVTDTRKQANKEEVRYDGLFKSPQGLKIKRIAPVFIGPASNPNPPGQSPKHSSHTSGISSCSSLGQGEGNTVHPGVNLHPRLTVSNEFKKPVAQTHCRPRNQNVQSNLDSTGQTKARRVDQWVDMVNMNSTMSKEPLHYPSCPPKIPKHFCPKVTDEAHFSCFQKPSTPHSSFLDKHKDIGIQTTLNCTVRCAKTNSLPHRVMKDVSTILSNSFLDAHSPGRIPAAASKKVDDGFKHNQAIVDDENIMFPEDYVYKFCPLNPNRIDSDDSTNLHQTECFRQGLKCFRPRRNVKRAFEEEIPNEVFSSPRQAKVLKLDNTVESLPNNTGPRDCSFTAVNSPSHAKCNGTFVVPATQITNSPKTIACCKHKCSNVNKPLNEALGQGHTVSKVGRLSTTKKLLNSYQRLFSKENCIRASTPTRLDNNNYGDHSCDFVRSSFSDICMEKCCGNNESWVSPKISAFLNSSRQHSGSNSRVCFQPEKDFDQNDFETSLDSMCSDVPLENPPSFLSPVKMKNYNSTFSPKRNKMTSFANNDSFADKDLKNSCVTSLGVSGRQGSGCKQMNNAPDTSTRNDTTFSGKSPKEGKNGATPCFSLHDYVIEGDLDKTGSGSFVDAHTPKAKVLRPSPRKVVLSGKSYLTDHKMDNFARLGENQAESQSIENHPSKITPHTLRQKRSFQKESIFEGPKKPSLTVSRKEKRNNANCLYEEKMRIDSDSMSTVKDGHKIYPRSSWEVDRDRPFTRANTNNSHNYGGTVEHNLDLSSVMDGTNAQTVPDVLPHSSKMNDLSDSLSTINGSNEFEECDSDNSFDSRSQIQNSGAKSTNKHFPSNSSKQTLAHQQHSNSHFTNHKVLLSKNAKRESADHKQRANSTQHQNQHKDKRKWKNSLSKSKAQNFHLTECARRFHRASTPVEQSRRNPPIPLNTSMSTIVGPQDEEEESDCYDEDWDTRLMEDVDIL